MRNPNGYGCVVNLGKKRRRPYAVRLTVGFDLIMLDDLTPKAVQKYKYLGYYETRKEAAIALAKYNANPYDIAASDITFKQVFEAWYAERFTDDDGKTSVKYSYTAAFKKCAALYDKKMCTIKAHDMQIIVDEATSRSSANNLCIIFRFMYSWAIKNDVLQKDYSQYVTMPSFAKSDIHKVFSAKEIETLWENTNRPIVRIALMLIYSGLRIGEFEHLTPADIDTKNQSITIRAAKTAAGVRTVPIADKTLPFWQTWQQIGVSRTKLKTTWQSAMSSLGMEHLFHDTRHTTVSLLTASGVPLELIKKIVGHAGTSVTENVYLHPQLSTMLDAINKI